MKMFLFHFCFFFFFLFCSACVCVCMAPSEYNICFGYRIYLYFILTSLNELKISTLNSIIFIGKFKNNNNNNIYFFN